jgi:hypothetical protein
MAKKTFKTPIGEAVYPRIIGKPDTKFKSDGEWKTGLRLDIESAQPLMKALDAELPKSVAAANADPKNNGKKFKPGAKPYTIEDNGDVLFNFKMNATGKDGKSGETYTRKPAVFGPDGLPMAQNTNVGGGSKIQVAYTVGYTVFGNKAFVKLAPKAVMIHELVEYGGTAASYGFDVSESEGETADNEDETEDETAEEEGEDDANDKDF